MTFTWREAHILPFIERYRCYEILWNPTRPEYRNRQLREKAAASMVVDLALPGLTTVDVVAKIKSIRTKYAAELGRVRDSEKSGASADDLYKPRLFWFDTADAFLRRWTQTKKSSSNSTNVANQSDHHLDDDTSYPRMAPRTETLHLDTGSSTRKTSKRKIAVSSVYSSDSGSSDESSRPTKAHTSLVGYLKDEVKDERRRNDALLFENATLKSKVEHLKEALELLKAENETLKKLIPNSPTGVEVPPIESMHPPIVVDCGDAQVAPVIHNLEFEYEPLRIPKVEPD